MFLELTIGQDAIESDPADNQRNGRSVKLRLNNARETINAHQNVEEIFEDLSKQGIDPLSHFIEVYVRKLPNPVAQIHILQQYHNLLYRSDVTGSYLKDYLNSAVVSRY